jgi:ankyrin repeat protein
MSTSPDAGGDRTPASDVRQLPPRPSLEYERKEAKQLLRQLHAHDATAIARVRAQWRGGESRDPTELRLADAQLTIAREYGFTSWPRLVSYFETLSRHERSNRTPRPVSHCESMISSLMAQHRNGDALAGQWLATFVPRFYGRSAEEALRSPITIDDARLVVARQSRCATWDELMTRARQMETDQPHDWELYQRPRGRVAAAVRASNLSELSALLDEYPEFLHADESDPSKQSLMQSAVVTELRSRSPEARAVTDWLATRGGDLEEALGRLLCSPLGVETETVAYLLARGADPSWVAPNGLTAFEHAVIRYWNPAAVDLLIPHVVTRKAFWIAAAFGDVEAVARYARPDGSLTAAARRDRPDFTAIWSSPVPSLPDAPDQDVIWEAFFVACLNQRAGVIDLLLRRGFPIDYAKWNGMTALNFAAGNRLVGLVELLVQRGASLDARGRHPDYTARDFARQNFQMDPTNAAALRILELCDAGDPDVVIREYEAKRVARTPELIPGVRTQIAAARAEARRRGQTETEPDNLYVAMFNAKFGFAIPLLTRAGADINRVLTFLGDRLVSSDVSDASSATDPELGAAAQAVMHGAVAVATSLRKEAVVWADVVVAMLDARTPLLLASLDAGGTTPERLREVVGEFR